MWRPKAWQGYALSMAIALSAVAPVLSAADAPSAAAAVAGPANSPHALAVQATALGQDLLQQDAPTPEQRQLLEAKARYLLQFGRAMDPHYKLVRDTLSALDSKRPVPLADAAPDSAVFVKNLLAIAGQEKDESRALMCYGICRVFDLDNPEAKAALQAAKGRGVEVSLSKLIEKNTQPVLTEELDYYGLIEPIYSAVLDDDMEKDADRLKDDLDEFGATCRRRMRQYESDVDIARTGRDLTGIIFYMMNQRRNSVAAFVRAKTYTPPTVDNNPALYEQRTQEGRDRGKQNAIRGWNDFVKKTRPTSDELLARLKNGMKDLQARLPSGGAATTAVASTGGGKPSRPAATGGRPTHPATTVAMTDTSSSSSNSDESSGGDEPVVRKEAPKLTSAGATTQLTPPELMVQVKELAQWLQAQEHRTGRFAEKIHAAQEGSNAVLYVEVTADFVKLPEDERFAITCAIQKMWYLRLSGAAERKVNNKDQALVYTVDNKQGVLGGSSPDKGTDVWVKKL